MELEITPEEMMRTLGAGIGRRLRGGECIELVGDVGAGKTTLVKGIALGLQIGESVQSPSFTISRVYEARDGLFLHHYDFYRLQEAGIMEYELEESLADSGVVTIVEWADNVGGVLPDDRVTVRIVATGEATRQVQISTAETFDYIIKGLEKEMNA